MIRFDRAALLAITFLSAFALTNSTVTACPFCKAQAQTFRQEMATMDAVVIAKLVTPPPSFDSPNADDSPEGVKAKFEVTKVLKGEKVVGEADDKDQRFLHALYYGDGEVGDLFLITGIDMPEAEWSTPTPLSTPAHEYLLKVAQLPTDVSDDASKARQLAFFYDYLNHEDEMISRDSYDEFANAPYETIEAIAEKLDREQVKGWLADLEQPSSRRRLFFVLLSVCAEPEDSKLLEEWIASDDRRVKSGLDAMIGCYLTIAPKEGMPFIKEQVFMNSEAAYSDIYASIMALRFHLTETELIPKEEILSAFHLVLKREDLADLVIPDLARMEDWSVVDELFERFKSADDETSWVKVPVINYLRACPLPKAKEHLKEIEKLDPAAVKRASIFLPFPNEDDTSNWQRNNDTQAVARAANKPVIVNPDVPRTMGTQGEGERAQLTAEQAHAAPISGKVAEKEITLPNYWQFLGVPLLAGCVLAGTFWLILYSPGSKA